MNWDFVRDRPRDLRGVSEQLCKLVKWGRELQVIHSARPLANAFDRAEWMLARGEVVAWAQAVTQRADGQRAERLPWAPGAKNVFWNEEQVFDAYVAAVPSLELRLRVWADEIDFLDEPAPETVIVDADTPFSSWLRIGDLIRSATNEVWVADPYITDDTLALFLTVPSGAKLRLLTRQGKGQTLAAWERFCRERGGLNEMRFAPDADMFHDRFFGVDVRVFLSGASLKDIGKRFSVLMELRDNAADIRARLEALWQRSPPWP